MTAMLAVSLSGVGVAVFIILVLGVTWLLAEHAARQRIRDMNASFNEWENWSQAHREGVLKRAVLGLAADFALMRRGMMIFTVTVVAAGTWAILAIQDTAEQSASVIDDVCALSEDFIDVQTQAVTEDIRGNQDARDELANNIIEMEDAVNSRTPLEQMPGYADLPESAQTFVQAFYERSGTDAEGRIEDAKLRLDVFDARLERLRRQVDDVRALQRKYSCAD